MPANLLLCFDGGGVVIQHGEAGPTGGESVLLDNLHASNAIPVTIVVGITPGRNPNYPEQRSLEYDTVRTQFPLVPRGSVELPRLNLMLAGQRSQCRVFGN